MAIVYSLNSPEPKILSANTCAKNIDFSLNRATIILFFPILNYYPFLFSIFFHCFFFFAKTFFLTSTIIFSLSLTTELAL